MPNDLTEAVHHVEMLRAFYEAGDLIEQHCGLTAAHLDAVLVRLLDTAHVVLIEWLS